MTTIAADIRDALRQPLSGYIQVDLDYDLESAVTTFLPVSAKIPLVGGTATFTLEPSESSQITYVFSVWRTESGKPDELVKEPFRAFVPDQTATLSFTDLTPTSIAHDQLETSLTAITRRLYNSDSFWAKFQDSLLQVKGPYDPSAWYQRGNLVFYQGGTYTYINRLASTGNAPTVGAVSLYWVPMALPGQTVTGALDPSVVATLATKAELNLKVSANGAALSNATTSDTLPITDNTSKLAYTAWVQAVLADVRKRLHNIGDVMFTVATAAPQFWVLADGRTLSRTTYVDLFNLVGTAFNTGGEAGTVFRLPDLRGRVPIGVDNLSGIMGAANRVPTATARGASGGAENKTLLIAEIPSHNHGGQTAPMSDSMDYSANTWLGYSGSGSIAGFQRSAATFAPFSNTELMFHRHNIPSQGGGQAFSIMQPYQALTPIIFSGV